MKNFINKIAYNIKNVSYLFLLILILNIQSCFLPVAPIQSTRVRTKPSGGISLILNKNNFKYQIDTLVEEHKWTYSSGGLKIGIKNRIELSGVAIPFIYMNIWDINLKVALFDFGKEKIFQSFSSAIFIGSSGCFNIASTFRFRNAWGGIVLGTHGIIGNSEIEFVLIPSITYNDYIESEEYLLDSAYQGVDFEFERKTCDIAFGIIFAPGKGRIAEVNTGLTYKYIFDKKLIATDNLCKILQFDESPIFFHLSLLLNISKKKK